MSEMIRTYWGEQYTKLVNRLDPSDITPEEMLFLALHVRREFIARIAETQSEGEDTEWVDVIAAGFASLLQQWDIDDLDRLYQRGGEWNKKVRPPSVIGPELMVFLGALSAASPWVFEGCNKRGSVQCYLRVLDQWRSCFERGVAEHSD